MVRLRVVHFLTILHYRSAVQYQGILNYLFGDVWRSAQVCALFTMWLMQL